MVNCVKIPCHLPPVCWVTFIHQSYHAMCLYMIRPPHLPFGTMSLPCPLNTPLIFVRVLKPMQVYHLMEISAITLHSPMLADHIKCGFSIKPLIIFLPNVIYTVRSISSLPFDSIMCNTTIFGKTQNLPPFWRLPLLTPNLVWSLMI